MTEPDINDRLARAAATLPQDVERRLDELHRGMPRRDRVRRVGVIALAATVALGAVAVAGQLRPGSDGTTVGTPGLTGHIALTRVLADPEGGGTADVMVADASSGLVQPVIEGAAADFFPVWSPQGDRVAFATGMEAGDALGIRVANADGSDPVSIDSGKVEFLAWAPSGDELAYVHSQDGSLQDDPDGIYLVGVDGTRGRRVVPGLWQSVSWSPDGELLVAAGWPENDGHTCPPDCTDVYTVRPDGSDLTRLTHDDTYDHIAVWSPDGTRIAVARSDEYDNVDYGSDISVMDADGGRMTRLTDWKGFDSFPVWSPDGSAIAFASDRDVPDEQQAANEDGAFAYIGIYVMGADGTRVRPLVAGEQDVALLPTSWTTIPG